MDLICNKRVITEQWETDLNQGSSQTIPQLCQMHSPTLLGSPFSAVGHVYKVLCQALVMLGSEKTILTFKKVL